MLAGKNLVLGIAGSIAAYKAIYLARLFVEDGAQVWPMLTQAATRFVGPLTLSAITGHRAVTDLWSAAEAGEIGHVELAHRADAVVLAPATADLLARLALGRADDALSAVALATRAPFVIAPAMEQGMWLHPATQEHVAALAARGARIVSPGQGGLASGRAGKGRLAEPEEIFEATLTALTPSDLEGERVVVTAGPTREPFDPARFVSNASSGRMGYALARVASRRGAQVVLISGPTDLPAPAGIELARVVTTAEMLEACRRALESATILVMAAAPVDFRPVEVSAEKRKKKPGGERLTLELESTPDILKALDARSRGVITVGFAAESHELLLNARKKLVDKNLDLVVANDITRTDAGFATDTNLVTLIERAGGERSLPLMSKEQVAWTVFDRIAALCNARRPLST